MSDWQPMATAPRDGTTILLWASDAGGPYEMFWNPHGTNLLVQSGEGIWELNGGGLTWCEERPDGAPTHWMPLPK